MDRIDNKLQNYKRENLQAHEASTRQLQRQIDEVNKLFASIEQKYCTKIALNSAVDGLGEEIASDINELETVIKGEMPKIE